MIRFGPRVRQARSRVSAAIFLAVGALSLLAMEVDYRWSVATLDETLTAVDHLSAAQWAVAQAYVAAMANEMGEPTFDATRSLGELETALGRVRDLRDGTASLLGFSPRTLVSETDSLTHAVNAYLALVQGMYQDALDDGRGQAEPVVRRLRFASAMRASSRLEQQVYMQVRARLREEGVRHLSLMSGWAAFLLLTGGALYTLRRSRERARLAALRAERRRAEAETDYANLKAGAAAGLVRAAADGTVLAASHWWYDALGLDLQSWVGQPWWAILAPQDRERFAQQWQARQPVGSPFGHELSVLDSANARRYLLVHWAPVTSPQVEEQRLWIGTFLDDSRRRSAEAQLHQAQKLEAVGRLTSGVAHDFNNLLTVVLSNVRLLQDGSIDGADREELLADIETASERGRGLVARLMGFSRRSELSVRPIDLGQAVRQASRLAAKLLPSEVRLHLHEPLGVARVYADPTAIEQVLLNLVSNARDAMPDGGRISLEVDQFEADAAYAAERAWIEPGTFGRIVVSDTGVGMDAETLARIFEPFFTTKGEGKGTGLGLASAHGLVRQMNGYIHAYSEPGVGTTFRIYLPRLAADVPVPLEPDAPERRAALPDGGPRLNVLLVEDDEPLRRTAKRILVRLGHEVVEAENGAQALRLLASSAAVDMVISDVAMEGVDGLELYRRLRAEGDQRPFVFTSGRSAREMSETETLPAGAFFLAKPWTLDDLKDAIASARRTPPPAAREAP